MLRAGQEEQDRKSMTGKQDDQDRPTGGAGKEEQDRMSRTGGPG